jgi:murein DD-endopeptidase MepM/ murein hydrolase activator NlpD
VSVLRPIGTIGDRKHSRAGAFLVVLLLGVAIGGAGGYYLGVRSVEPPPGMHPAAAQTAPAEGSTVAQAGAPVQDQPLPESGPDAGDLKRLDLRVRGSLYATMAPHLDGRKADILNAQVGRVLVWWFDLRRDVLKNDRLQLVFKPVDDPSELQLQAIRYTSRKMNRTFSAYLYKPAASRYQRYYDESGTEIEKRLVNAPLKEYEQITELMNLSGRRHRGVDFKADIGSAIVAPFRSKVMRRNWHTRRNGNCLQLQYLDSGISAIFLHLDEVLPEIKPGMVVEAGTLVARTGNTGHSTAPHLHYELHGKSGKPLNPFEAHKTVRYTLGKEDLIDFKDERDRLDGLMPDKEPGDESAPSPAVSSPSKVTPG